MYVCVCVCMKINRESKKESEIENKREIEREREKVCETPLRDGGAEGGRGTATRQSQTGNDTVGYRSRLARQTAGSVCITGACSRQGLGGKKPLQRGATPP